MLSYAHENPTGAAQQETGPGTLGCLLRRAEQPNPPPPLT
jgi:hypothetical protein